MMYNKLTTVAKAEALVRLKMSSYDPSHDALHVWRVRRLALKIADAEIKRNGAVIDTDIVELAALFHDLQDHKYVKKESADEKTEQGIKRGSLQTTSEEMEQILIDGGLEQKRMQTVLKIVQNTSYSTEIKLRNAGKWTEWHENNMELKCVQDADRLDAIGTFGLFRASAYSGAINKPLYAFQDDRINSAATDNELPKYSIPGYENRAPQDIYSSYQHFHDKLLLLKDRMKTETGRIVGAKRHEYMAKVIDAMDTEFDLADFP